MKIKYSIQSSLISLFIVTSAFSQLQVTFSGDTTKIWDKNISWYCGGKFTMIVSRVGDSITVVERDTFPRVRCTCHFTLCASILGLPSGNYTAYVKRQLVYSFLGENVDTTFSIGTIAFNVNTSSTGNLFVKSYQSECSETTVIRGKQSEIPNSHYLLTNYPNPFNPQTVIHYVLPKSSITNISVYDIHGKLVKVLFDKYSDAGEYDITFDASDLSSGIYFVRMKSEQLNLVNKIVLIK